MTERRAVTTTGDGTVSIACSRKLAPNCNYVECHSLRTLVSAGTEIGKITGRFYWSESPCELGYSNVAIIGGDGSPDWSKGQRLYSQAPHADLFFIDADALAKPRPLLPCPLPQNVSNEDAAFVTLAAVAWYALGVAGPQEQDEALVIGDGLVGQLLVRLARFSKLSRVHLAGHHEFRLQKARGYVQSTVNSAKDDLQDFVEQSTGGKGFPLVIDAAGTQGSIGAAIQSVARRGKTVLLGTIPERVALPLWELQKKEVTLNACFQPQQSVEEQWASRRRMISMLAEGKLLVTDLVTHRFCFTRAADAYQLLQNDRDSALGVLFMFDEPGAARSHAL